MEYLVEWTIDVEADSPQEAAIKARQHQRARNTTATCFFVREQDGERVLIDLEEYLGRAESSYYEDDDLSPVEPRADGKPTVEALHCVAGILLDGLNNREWTTADPDDRIQDIDLERALRATIDMLYSIQD